MKHLKFIRLWWKTIFQIIKIQKNIRGFLFRLKLIIYLDESENLFKSLLNFILQIKKSICRNVFYELVKNINKESTIEISKSKKLVNKSNNYNIQKIKKSSNKKVNNKDISKYDDYIKFKINEKNNKKCINLAKRNDYLKEIYKSNKELNNKSIFRNKTNSITIINNTNNIYNNIINENNKYIIKRDINTKKIKTKNKNIINNNMKKDDIIINNLTKKEVDITNTHKHFNFWRIKNIKKIILNKFHSIFLISKFK